MNTRQQAIQEAIDSGHKIALQWAAEDPETSTYQLIEIAKKSKRLPKIKRLIAKHPNADDNVIMSIGYSQSQYLLWAILSNPKISEDIKELWLSDDTIMIKLLNKRIANIAFSYGIEDFKMIDKIRDACYRAENIYRNRGKFPSVNKTARQIKHLQNQALAATMIPSYLINPSTSTSSSVILTIGTTIP